jgi:hypothetical protein
VRAHLAPFPGVRLDFDGEAEFGQGSVGHIGLRVTHLPNGLTRLTTQRPRG